MTLSNRLFLSIIVIALVAGCGSITPRGTGSGSAVAPAAHTGGYYLNDGPGDNPPVNLDKIPDAIPKIEPLKSGLMKPYNVMGQTYTPLTALAPYKARGIASWYGRRYHGQKTASGEIYDMYAMTAAHTILPIPSYARVTNLQNGKSVVVRINDRGPFLSDRLIDLSYTAAYKLGVLGGGKALVEVDSIIPGIDTPLNSNVATTNAEVPVAVPDAAPAMATAAAALPAALIPSAEAAPTPPPPETNASPAAPVVTIVAESQGIFLQLGAFGTQDHAENYLTKLRVQADALAPLLQVYNKGDGLFRVRAGPYASEATARQAAEQINQSLGIKAIVITR